MSDIYERCWTYWFDKNAMINHLLRASSSTAHVLVVLSFVSHSLSLYRCDAILYGTPGRSACWETFSLMPEAIRRDSPAATARHLFVEPQYLLPPFSPVRNPYDNQIIQVPKIWRTGSLDNLHQSVLSAKVVIGCADT